MGKRQRLTSGAVVWLCLCTAVARAQLHEAELAELRATAKANGWTFSVGANSVTDLPLESLCGLKEPSDWRSKTAGLQAGKVILSDLPATFDWRTQAGCPPVRNQRNCGACWAFGTVGALECAIRIKDLIDVDLSEQWLISCNQDGWSCSGGWFAHDYHMWKTDTCEGTGAVPENSFPYTATNSTCACPYPHPYFIDSWAYVDPTVNIPDPQLIKQAIYDHGPVSVAICSNSAMQGYTSGIFNACSTSTVNHGVVLVGWDDNQGPGGVWFARNSWGAGWGEAGYMRIPYGCSSVGYGACYIEYAGQDDLRAEPTSGLAIRGEVGGPFVPASSTYNLSNIGLKPLLWSADKSATWLDAVPSGGTIPPGDTVSVAVSASPAARTLAAGTYTETLVFSNLETGKTRPRTITLGVGQPDDFTELFDANDCDLSDRSILFTPNGTANYYGACTEPIASLPIDPAGGTPLALSDDSFAAVALSAQTVSFYGSQFSTFYVGSNGYITFGSGSSAASESIDVHFSLMRISALFHDLDPSVSGARVSWRQLSDRVAVTWASVPDYGKTQGKTFQVEMFGDGRVRLSWLALPPQKAVVGLSRGSGRPAFFMESDLSDRLSCQPPRPIADFDHDSDVDMEDFGHLQRCLTDIDLPVADLDCLDARLDPDLDVDQDDLLIFQNCLSAPGSPAQSQCPPSTE